MAIIPALQCRFPQDLDNSIKLLEQDIGDRLTTLLNEVSNVEQVVSSLDSSMDAGTNILNQLLAIGGGSIGSTNDMSDVFGLPPDDTDTAADEKFLFSLGIILFDGVVYASGDKSPVGGDSNNIEVLRKLYFAAGRELSLVEKIMAENKSQFLYNKIDIRKIPAKVPKTTAYTLQEIKDDLSAQYLTNDDYVVLNDFSSLVFLTSYLASNIPISKIHDTYNLDYGDVKTSVFHFSDQGSINKVSDTQKYIRYGFGSGDRLSAILAPSDLMDLPANSVGVNIKDRQKRALNVASNIDFILSRYDTLSTTNLTTSRTNLRGSISEINKLFKNDIADTEFEVTLIQQRDTLSKLRKKHSDEQIVRLLEERPEIVGIWFDAPQEEIQKILNGSYQTKPGSTLASNKFMNQKSFSNVSRNTLMLMLSYLNNADYFLSLGNEPKRFQDSRSELIQFSQAVPISTYIQQPQPYDGQPSYATPSSILADRFDSAKTFDMDTLVVNVEVETEKLFNYYRPEIAQALKIVINAVTALFKLLIRACDIIISKMRNLIMPIKKKVDAFLSKANSLVGNGNLSKSVLGCTLGINLGLSFGVINQLIAFLDGIQNQLMSFFSELANLIANLLQQMLCLPISLINGILGSVASLLPVDCNLPSFQLNDEIIDALSELRGVADARYNNIMAFNQDLIKIRAGFISTKNRVSQFKGEALCNSGPVNSFFGAATLNVGL